MHVAVTNLKDTAAMTVYKLFLPSPLGAVVLLTERRLAPVLVPTAWLSECMSEQMDAEEGDPFATHLPDLLLSLGHTLCSCQADKNWGVGTQVWVNIVLEGSICLLLALKPSRFP